MNEHYQIVGVASKGGGIQEVRDHEGVRTIAVNMTRTISPFNDLISVVKLYKLIKKEKPFIVHTHTPKAGTLGILAARIAGVKHRLHTVAGMPLLETNGIKRFVLNTVERFTYYNATLILPNSYGLYDIILQQNFTSEDKLKIIGRGSSNGIDTNYFDPNNIQRDEKERLRHDLSFNEDDIVFIFIGRLVKDKGTTELISAFCELHNTRKNCKLLLVGLYESHIDPLNEETNKMIENHEAITFVGRKSDVRPYLAVSDVLAFPSYREGFPNVVMEAGAMGLPSIVTNINGCNEIIEHDKNGLLIPPKQTKALLDAMVYMIDNPSERKRMAGNSRENIVTKYQRSYVWDEILKLYKQLEESYV